jgi:hypothetical protein
LTADTKPQRKNGFCSIEPRATPPQPKKFPRRSAKAAERFIPGKSPTNEKATNGEQEEGVQKEKVSAALHRLTQMFLFGFF